MKELLDYLEYTKLFLLISLGMVALTYLVHIIFKNKKVFKYFPGLISIFIGIYGFITIDGSIFFLDDIDNITIFIMATSVGLVGIFVALIIGIFNKGKIKKQKKTEKTI